MDTILSLSIEDMSYFDFRNYINMYSKWNITSQFGNVWNNKRLSRGQVFSNNRTFNSYSLIIIHIQKWLSITISQYMYPLQDDNFSCIISYMISMVNAVEDK